MILFRSTCRNAFSLSRCGRGCLTCAAATDAPAEMDGITAAPIEFATLMARHPRRPQHGPGEPGHGEG